MMTVRAFAEDFIARWEDGGADDPARCFSRDPADAGNWTGGAPGQGHLLGSQHGVTAATLAAFRACALDAVTPAMLRAVTRAEAAAIAERLFYQAPGLSALPWSQLVASVTDFGWGAGPRVAVRQLQRLIGVVDDGFIGLATQAAFKRWVGRLGLGDAADLWAATRDEHYRAICRQYPADARFLRGWLRRTAYFRPGTAWWRRFDAA